MLSPTYEITTALSHTDELISPPYDIAIVTISYGRVTMSSVWDSMMSKKNMGWPFYAAVITNRTKQSTIKSFGFYIQKYSISQRLYTQIHVCCALWWRLPTLPISQSCFAQTTGKSYEFIISHETMIYMGIYNRWIHCSYDHIITNTTGLCACCMGHTVFAETEKALVITDPVWREPTVAPFTNMV